MPKKTLHSILSDSIREKIVFNIYQPGDILPSENQLCERYGVSRFTVRTALETLVNEGLIYPRQGKGYFVRDYDFATYSMGFTIDELTDIKRDTVTTIEEADDEIRKILHLMANEKEVYVLRRTIRSGNEIVAYDIQQLVKRDITDFVEKKSNAVFSRIRDKENEYPHIGDISSFVMSVSIADNEIAGYLDVKVGEPIMLVHRYMESLQGIRVGFGTTYFRKEYSTIIASLIKK